VLPYYKKQYPCEAIAPLDTFKAPERERADILGSSRA
jgi:hypothetical protein